jgi:hypothetical protein
MFIHRSQRCPKCIKLPFENKIHGDEKEECREVACYRDTTRASEFCGSNSTMDWQLNIPVLAPGSKVSDRSTVRRGAPTATRSGKKIRAVAARAILQAQPSRSTTTYLNALAWRRPLSNGAV